MMTKEELEKLYGTLPENIDIDKFNLLLKKKPNKYPLIDDVYGDFLNWLRSEDGLDIQEIPVTIKNLKGEDETIKSIIINEKVLVFVIDNYTVYNKFNLGKDISAKLHKEYQAKGYRVIWNKKFEWENPNKQRVMKSLILHALGKTKNRVFARNTVAEIIPNKELREFFDNSSFYGYRNAGVDAVCLRDKKTGEILEAMSFGKPYYGKDKYGNAIECIRAASKPFTIVVGGSSKLMKFFVEKFGDTFDSVLYYVDDAHYNNQSMEAIGFEYSHFTGHGVHNVFVDTGSQFVRTPKLHTEIKFLSRLGMDEGYNGERKIPEIANILDVGNSVFLWHKPTENTQ